MLCYPLVESNLHQPFNLICVGHTDDRGVGKSVVGREDLVHLPFMNLLGSLGSSITSTSSRKSRNGPLNNGHTYPSNPDHRLVRALSFLIPCQWLVPDLPMIGRCTPFDAKAKGNGRHDGPL
jgi:hypothetical protein